MLPPIDYLQDDIPLYNNLALYQEHQGRLSSHLVVFPSPEIQWEFEVLGDEVNQKGHLRFEMDMSPLRGYRFEIAKPYPTMGKHDYKTPKECLSGIATQAVFGDIEFKAHAFRFYLPNTRFQFTNISGQQMVTETRKTEDADLDEKLGGRILMAKLDEVWHITLQVSEESLSWLDKRKKNIGSRITSIGYLDLAPKKWT